MLPPFTELNLSRYYWTITLESWSGFRCKVGAGAGRTYIDSNGEAGFEIYLVENHTEPTPEQVAAYEYLREHEAAITQAILVAFFEEYPYLQDCYYPEGEERDAYMPDISAPEDLKMFIGLESVTVFTVDRDGIAYFGFEIASTWDPEHSSSIAVHRDRVIGDGGPSGAMCLAKADAKSAT